MTCRNRKLLDLAHDAPCMLLLGLPGCGNDKSVPCHSDMLRHGRGVGHKSHDCFAVPGCPVCHARFTRAALTPVGYEAVWLAAFERWTVYLWTRELVALAKQEATGNGSNARDEPPLKAVGSSALLDLTTKQEKPI